MFEQHPSATHFRYPYVYGPYQLRAARVVRRAPHPRRPAVHRAARRRAHALSLRLRREPGARGAARGRPARGVGRADLQLRRRGGADAAPGRRDRRDRARRGRSRSCRCRGRSRSARGRSSCRAARTHRVFDLAKLRTQLGYRDVVPAREALRAHRALARRAPARGGGMEERVLQDPFDYAAEDALVAAWRSALAALPTPDVRARARLHARRTAARAEASAPASSERVPKRQGPSDLAIRGALVSGKAMTEPSRRTGGSPDERSDRSLLQRSPVVHSACRRARRAQRRSARASRVERADAIRGSRCMQLRQRARLSARARGARGSRPTRRPGSRAADCARRRGSSRVVAPRMPRSSSSDGFRNATSSAPTSTSVGQSISPSRSATDDLLAERPRQRVPRDRIHRLELAADALPEHIGAHALLDAFRRRRRIRISRRHLAHRVASAPMPCSRASVGDARARLLGEAHAHGARRRVHEHQRRHALRVREREAQRDHAAERVTEQVRRARARARRTRRGDPPPGPRACSPRRGRSSCCRRGRAGRARSCGRRARASGTCSRKSSREPVKPCTSTNGRAPEPASSSSISIPRTAILRTLDIGAAYTRAARRMRVSERPDPDCKHEAGVVRARDRPQPLRGQGGLPARLPVRRVRDRAALRRGQARALARRSAEGLGARQPPGVRGARGRVPRLRPVRRGVSRRTRSAWSGSEIRNDS